MSHFIEQTFAIHSVVSNCVYLAGCEAAGAAAAPTREYDIQTYTAMAGTTGTAGTIIEIINKTQWNIVTPESIIISDDKTKMTIVSRVELVTAGTRVLPPHGLIHDKVHVREWPGWIERTQNGVTFAGTVKSHLE
jgi:hypothetical protein